MTQNNAYVLGYMVAILLNGCAFDLVHVEQIPTKLDSSSSANIPFVLQSEARVKLGTGYRRVLRAGTKWEYVGTVPYGDVYKTRDQIVTVEASNIHEAYIVVSANKLVGFYLPVERSYSPLPDSVELNMRREVSNP